MSVAKVTEISAASKKSFEDAVEQGIARASKTLKNVVGAWVGETTPIFVHEIPSDQQVDEFLEDLGFEPPISPSNDN